MISKNKGSKNKSTIVAKGPTYVNADIQKADILNDNASTSSKVYTNELGGAVDVHTLVHL